MSTVKATHFQHPSASDVNVTLNSDGTLAFPQGFAGGLGTNVVQAVKTDTFTTASTSFVDVTGLSVTITPTSATSKIFIVASVCFSAEATGGIAAHLQFAGGNTSSYIGDAASLRTQALAGLIGDGSNGRVLNGYASVPFILAYLDSPATTLATTYTVQMRTSSASAYVNRSAFDSDSAVYHRTASSITAIEVAA